MRHWTTLLDDLQGWQDMFSSTEYFNERYMYFIHGPICDITLRGLDNHFCFYNEHIYINPSFCKDLKPSIDCIGTLGSLTSRGKTLQECSVCLALGKASTEILLQRKDGAIQVYALLGLVGSRQNMGLVRVRVTGFQIVDMNCKLIIKNTYVV